MEAFNTVAATCARDVRDSAKRVLARAMVLGIQPSRVAKTSDGLCFYFFPGGHTVGL